MTSHKNSKLSQHFRKKSGSKVHFARELTAFDYEHGKPLSTPIKTPEPEEEKPIEKQYKRICSNLSIIPVSYIQKRLTDEKIKIRSRGLGPKGARALAIILVKNHTIEQLDIGDNDIGDVGARALAEMLDENTIISALDISENRLGEEGIESLCEVIARHDTLKTLHLSGIGCQNRDVKHVKSMLDQNMHLRQLYLAHNEISDQGCVLLQKAISDNDTLELLDLSWNHIRGDGAVAIGYGLRENRGIRVLNLEYNGFGLEGCKSLCQALGKNKTLLDLNLSSNRIHVEALSVILIGLKRNTTLSKLKLRGNPLTPGAAFYLLQTVSKMRHTNIREVDIMDIVICEDFLELLHEMRKRQPLVVKHGPLLTHTNHQMLPFSRSDIEPTDPRALLLRLMDNDGLSVTDLFHEIDTDGNYAVTRKEFKNRIMNAELPVTEGQLDEILDLMDADGNGEIDIGEIILFQEECRQMMKIQKTRQLNLEAAATAAEAAAQQQKQQLLPE